MDTSQADSDPVIRELEALLDEGAVSDHFAASQPAASDALAGLAPRYQLNGLVGVGGMGQVYDAHDTLLHRRVAIKVVGRGGPMVADLMRREREVLAALEHPGIVAVYDCGELAQGQPYYVMQYVEGLELRDYVMGQGLSFDRKLRLVAEIARAVGVAHLLKVVHRDLKPSNIKVTTLGRPMILDFGLAKFTASRDLDDGASCDHPTFQTLARGRVKGTLAYMSPEQAAGESVDSRSDTYALGVILYELLAGRLPRDPQAEGSTPLDWSHRLRSTPLPLDAMALAGVPRAVRAILAQAMEPDPDRRYANGIALADDLEAFLEHRSVSAVRRLRGLHVARAFARRNRRAIGVGVLILSVLATTVVMAFLRIREERNHAEHNAAQALRERRRAIERANATRRFLYAADLGQAHRLWQNQQIDKAQALLDRYLPAPGQDDLRSFEWRFLQKLCRNRPLDLRGHAAEVTAVRYAPDGRRLASADAAGVLRVWDAETGRQLSTFAANASPILQADFFADAKTLFAVGADRYLRLWDPASGRPLRSYWWFWRNLTAAACASDGRLMAVADNGGWVYFWDAQTGAVLGQIAAHPDRGVRSVAFSPDGTKLATGGKDSTARIWDVSARRQIAVFQPHLGPIDAVCFSGDGRRLATGGVDRTLRVWEIAEPTTPAFQWFAADEIVGVGFGEQTDRVWAACKNGTVNYLNTAGDQRSTLHTSAVRLRSASVTADMRRIASTAGDQTVQLWRGEQLVEFRRIANAEDLLPIRLDLAPDGDLLAVIYLERPLVDIFSTATRSRVARLADFTQVVTAAAFSADGRSLLTTDRAGGARLWHTGSWSPAAAFAAGNVFKTAIAVAPDGRFALADAAGAIEIYDTLGRSPRAGCQGHDKMAIVDAAFSSDGRWLASSGWDKTIHLWDAETGQLAHVLRGHQGIVHGVRFSPDGRHLASTSADGTLRLWSRRNGAELTTLWRQPYETYGLCFTPDGRTLAASSADAGGNSSAEVRMWNLETLQETLNLKVGGCQITGLCFGRRGDRLVGGVGPGPTGAGVLMWDAEPAKTDRPPGAPSAAPSDGTMP